ncbi:P-II family nitrogen regulator [Pectinatus frisingensis]|jgi:nitrogen regulatory protein PII 2|uniref:P-II family nitrogen regulator n=1 Tax=Pectinatus frisingensis TaxID=865 RepID=UPI0015F5A789|nr:P-II family nitrogen regulator [Pectinatus frisingensis]
MKEIMAFLRMNRINDTKAALAKAGYPSFTVSKAVGRGKKPLATEAINVIVENAGEVPANAIGVHLSEGTRLVPRRSFSLIVDDSQVELAVNTIITINQTGQPGDGKIFVMPVTGGYNIRTGQYQEVEMLQLGED